MLGRRALALLVLLGVHARAVAADDAAVCSVRLKNTLSTDCFSACTGSGDYPLCVNYAPAWAQNMSSEAGEGDYYYQGCDFPGMDSCVTNVTSANCELQCLQIGNINPVSWVLHVAPPQQDKADTALFQVVDELDLPPTLVNLSIVGGTGTSRRVPLTFTDSAFTSGKALERIEIFDVSIDNITDNIFPSSLQTLIIQRSQLQQFDPRGSRTFTSIDYLDLSDNAFTDLPLIIYELGNLSTLNLAGNPINDAHVTLAQWQFLKSLAVFTADLTTNVTCSAGYTQKSWDDKSVCVLATDGMSDIGSESGEGVTATADSTSTSSLVIIVVIIVSVIALIAMVAGVCLLKRAKRKAETVTQHDSPESVESKLKSSVRNLLSSHFAMSTDGLASTVVEESYHEHGNGSGDVLRKAAFKDIPPEHVTTLVFMTRNGEVNVSKAEHLTRLVTLHQLKISDDVGENSETAHCVVPILSQMRHPQLLTVTGLVWDDVYSISAVCEHMNLGTLEDFLRSSARQLNWQNFKMKAACEVARALMYLHSQHNAIYDGLNGRSVFVDTDKGCKLNTLLAAMSSSAGFVQRASMFQPQDSQRSLRHCDSSTKAFFAPEILAGEQARSSSDMYAFGVLLAHLDTCEQADEMIRSSWRIRTTQLDTSALSASVLGGELDGGSRRGRPPSSTSSTSNSSKDLDSSRRETTRIDDLRSTSLMNMFTFTDECPGMVKELATACLQYDPSLRPSASYISAMLHY